MKALYFGNCSASRQRGLSTLEILIAISILTMIMAAVISVVFSNQLVAVDVRTDDEALSRAQDLLEHERSLSRQDFSSVQSSGTSSDDIYQKSVSVQSIDATTKQATSFVAWTSAGRSLWVRLSTILTDTSALPGSCSQAIAGDWKNPQAYAFHSEALASQATGNNSNGLGMSDLQIYKNKLYIVANTTANDNNSFYIFSVPSDPATLPTYFGRTTTTGSSINALALGVQGGNLYAYVANSKKFNFTSCSIATHCPQFQAIDATDSANPALVSTASLKMPVTGSGGQGIGNSIYYSGGYIYLGLAKAASGPEFNIIDVHNPLNPSWVGGYSVGRTVNSIFVQGNYAYLATDDNSGGNKQLLILDTSDKSNPHLTTTPVGGFFAAAGIGYGNALALSGTKLYLGRSWAGSSAPNLYILDAANPASYPSPLPVLGSEVIGTSATPDSVDAVAVRSYLLFLGTNRQFQVWNISNPAAPYPWSPDGTVNTFLALSAINTKARSVSALGCSGTIFYLALKTSLGNNKDILAVIVPG